MASSMFALCTAYYTSDETQGIRKCVLGKPTISAKPSVYCAHYILAPEAREGHRPYQWTVLPKYSASHPCLPGGPKEGGLGT